MNFGRVHVGSGVLWCGLLLLVGLGFSTLRASQSRFKESQRQVQECEKLVNEIKALQSRPGFAAFDVDSARTITARAEEALSKANLPPTSLIRIEPQPAVRLRDTDYRVRPTRLQLRGVTLKQVVAFAHAMTGEARGTTVRDLRLNASGEVEEFDAWTAELVLTQLIFSPAGR